MKNKNKLLDAILWAVVVFAILAFVVSIIVGHSTNYNFFSNINTIDVPSILGASAQYIPSKLM